MVAAAANVAAAGEADQSYGRLTGGGVGGVMSRLNDTEVMASAHTTCNGLTALHLPGRFSRTDASPIVGSGESAYLGRLDETGKPG